MRCSHSVRRRRPARVTADGECSRGPEDAMIAPQIKNSSDSPFVAAACSTQLLEKPHERLSHDDGIVTLLHYAPGSRRALATEARVLEDHAQPCQQRFP